MNLKFILSFIFLLVTSPVYAQNNLLVSNQIKTPELPADFPNSAETHTVSIMAYGDGIGSCTGVIYKETENRTYILTAKHCVQVSEEVYVNNIPVILSITSSDDDLAVMIVNGKIPNKTPAAFADNDLRIGERIFHIGYPEGVIIRSFGEVTRTSKDWVWANMIVIPGCSGGPVFNSKGELNGIVWGMLKSQSMAIFESLNDIKRFLLTIDENIK